MIDALCVAIAIDFTELIARLKSKDSVLPRFTGLYNCFNDNAQKQDKIECFEGAAQKLQFLDSFLRFRCDV